MFKVLLYPKPLVRNSLPKQGVQYGWLAWSRYRSLVSTRWQPSGLLVLLLLVVLLLLLVVLLLLLVVAGGGGVVGVVVVVGSVVVVVGVIHR